MKERVQHQLKNETIKGRHFIKIYARKNCMRFMHNLMQKFDEFIHACETH